MSLGDDLSQVFEEVGTSCTVIKSDLSENEEHFDYEAFPDHSTVFIRQNCYAATFAHDSVVQDGDVIKFSDITSLVMNKKAELFENSAVVQNAYLIHCNTVTGVLSRKTSERVNYQQVNTWTPYMSLVHALHYASNMDKAMSLIEDAMSLEKEVYTLYLSHSVDVIKGDRWQFTPGAEAYKITTITDFRYTGLHVCEIEKDLRE